MGKNFGIGVGTREGASFVRGTGRPVGVVKIGLGEEPEERVVKVGWEGLAVDPEEVTVVEVLAAD